MKASKRPKQPPAHPLYWCDTCNLPLLMATCENRGHRVKISPPGDIRPASPFEKHILHHLLTNLYGCSIERKVILLNKTSGIDKTDEVIIDGHRFATLYYDIITSSYKARLDEYGAALLLPQATKQIVKIKHQHRHIKGKTLPNREILEEINIVDETQDVLVTDGKNLQAAGRIVTKKDGTTGLRITKINTRPPVRDLKNPGIQDVLRANRTHMKKKPVMHSTCSAAA